MIKHISQKVQGESGSLIHSNIIIHAPLSHHGAKTCTSHSKCELVGIEYIGTLLGSYRLDVKTQKHRK